MTTQTEIQMQTLQVKVSTLELKLAQIELDLKTTNSILSILISGIFGFVFVWTICHM